MVNLVYFPGSIIPIFYFSPVFASVRNVARVLVVMILKGECGFLSTAIKHHGGIIPLGVVGAIIWFNTLKKEKKSCVPVAGEGEGEK